MAQCSQLEATTVKQLLVQNKQHDHADDRLVARTKAKRQSMYPQRGELQREVHNQGGQGGQKSHPSHFRTKIKPY